MKITITIPYSGRREYMSRVLESLASARARNEVFVIIGYDASDDAGTISWLSSHADKVVQINAKRRTAECYDSSLIQLLDEGLAVSDVAFHHADDNLFAPDYIPLAKFITTLDGGIAFGMWWPTSRVVPSDVPMVRRAVGGWPAKSWGVTAAQWSELKPVVQCALDNRTATNDMALAQYSKQTLKYYYAPCVSRTKDIGRSGSYVTEQEWDRAWQCMKWVETDYNGEYKLAEGPPFDAS